MKTFNDWYNLIQEGIAEPSAEVSEPTVDQPTTNTTTQNPTSTSNREVIINDVDSIMTSLETLSSELKESLKLEKSELAAVGAAVAGAAATAGLAKGAKMLYDAKIKAPKARKEQAKVNAMNLKIAGVESTFSSADKDQKDKLKAKLDAIKSSRDELQKAIEDRYKDSSSVVKRSIAAEKTKGKMEVLKIHIGDATPEQQKDIKNQLAKLKNKSAEDTKLLQQSVEDVKNNTSDEDAAAVKKLGKGDAGAKATQKELDAADKSVSGAKAAYDEVKDSDDEKAKLQAEIKVKQAQQKRAKLKGDDELHQGLGNDIGELMKKMEALGKDNADDTTKKEREDKNSKEGKLARLNDLMKKAKESGDESKIKKVQDLIDKVSAKEAWQIEGTNLGMILESEITTLEMSFKLNESKYTNSSIKDKFSRLL